MKVNRRGSPDESRSVLCRGPASGASQLLASTVIVLATAGTLLAQGSARDVYTRALADERALRAPTREPLTLTAFRKGIAAYEAIMRRYPRSGYSDNALWQGAGLALEAYDRFRDKKDLRTGLRLLQALPREYPTSSLVPRVNATSTSPPNMSATMSALLLNAR